MLTASYLFSGYSDYWSGQSNRGCGKGCAFAYCGRDTTLRDLVDQWIEDVNCNEYDFGDLPENIGDDDIREAILNMLTDEGRRDYDNDVICEFSKEWAEINPDIEKDDCYESPVVIILLEWED